MRTYSRRSRLPREETQSCGDVGAAKNTEALARMIFPLRRERAPQARTGTYLFRRQPKEDATDKVKIVPTGNNKRKTSLRQYFEIGTVL